MKRRDFFKLMGAGMTPLAVSLLCNLPMDTLAPSATVKPGVTRKVSTPTAIIMPPSATPTIRPVPAPARGLASNSNYFLYNDFEPVTGLSVTMVDNWPSDSFRQSLNLPAGRDLINSPGQLMLTLPRATLPAAYKFTISLTNDKDQNVNAVSYLIVDDKGKTSKADIPLESLFFNHTNPAKPIAPIDLAPISVFELNPVGPTNGEATRFSAGAGAIPYTASSPLTVLSKKPSCCAAQGVFTKESGNSVYGTLFAGPSQTITQSFDTV